MEYALKTLWKDNLQVAHITDIGRLTAFDTPMPSATRYTLIADILEAMEDTEHIQEQDDSYRQL